MKLKPKKRRVAAKKQKDLPLHTQTKQNLAIEQPLRAHDLQMQVIAARNKKLDALKAAGIRNEMQRIEQMLHDTRALPHASIQATATRLKNELHGLKSKYMIILNETEANISGTGQCNFERQYAGPAAIAIYTL